ncbi:MAG: T9SS C-terminal target domain-containing protein, partial [Ignavibacteriae bacterium]
AFSASVSGNDVILEWITATEINNLGFEVERKSLNSAYEMVGYVSGAGSITEQRYYTFIDSKISNGIYTYRLKQIDFEGSFEYSNEVEIEVIAPSVYILEQNYPNPFNPSTNINFSIAKAGKVKIAIYNLLGQEVKLLLNEFKEVGPHTITFDASSLTSGSYFYTLETSQFRQTKKMLLAK